MIDMSRLTMPNGATYEPGARQAAAGPVLKATAAAARKAAAIAELEAAAERFERKALDGAYTLQKDLLGYYEAKAKSCRREAAKLRGEDVPEPGPVVKTRTVVIDHRR
jgi:hypothetical protein